MDLNQVKTFVNVVKSGSFASAARDMGIPRSTVSTRISNLEEKLGCRLFKRDTRSMVLTDSGEDFLVQVEQAINALEKTSRLWQVERSEIKGLIRLSVPSDFPMQDISEALLSFTQIHPLIAFDIEMSNRCVDLIQSNRDIALRVGIPEQNSYVIQRLGELRYVLVASREYFLQNKKPKQMNDLKDHKLLAYSEEGNTSRYAPISFLLEQGYPCYMASNSLSFIKNLVVNHAGIACLPEPTCQQELEQGQLEALPLKDWSPHDVSLYMVFSSKQDISPSIRLFATHLKKQLS